MTDYQLCTLIGGILSPLVIAWGMWIAWRNSRLDAQRVKVRK